MILGISYYKQTKIVDHMTKLIGLIFLPVGYFTSRIMENMRSYCKEKKSDAIPR
jgi:hypothetical protein